MTYVVDTARGVILVYGCVYMLTARLECNLARIHLTPRVAWKKGHLVVLLPGGPAKSPEVATAAKVLVPVLDFQILHSREVFHVVRDQSGFHCDCVCGYEHVELADRCPSSL